MHTEQRGVFYHWVCIFMCIVKLDQTDDEWENSTQQVGNLNSFSPVYSHRGIKLNLQTNDFSISR